MPDAFIEVTNLTKSYKRGKIKAVDGVSFSVDEGEVYGLIGPNGAGKTTLMGCLLALLHPNSGEVRINGKAPDEEEIRRVTGFLPERPSYHRWYTVENFLKLHYMLAEQPESECDDAINTCLEQVKLDLDVKEKLVRQLSRGMLQRLGLAQMIIGKPRICFMDEPTSGMDPLGFMLVRDFLTKCKDDGVTVILNSHHLQEVESVCDRVAFIRKGKIEAIESVKAVYERSQIMIVRWTKESETVSPELLSSIGETHGAALINSESSMAKFSVESEDKAAELINALYREDIKVYESNFEKKSLVDLFLTAENEETLKKEEEQID